MIYEQRFDRITSSDLSVTGSKGVHTHTLLSTSLSLKSLPPASHGHYNTTIYYQIYIII